MSEKSERVLKRAFWAAGIALILAGSWAWYDRFANADQHTNYGSLVPWGLWVSAYIYFIGLSAGSFLVCCMRLAPYVAFASAVFGARIASRSSRFTKS